jgi:hypothetical protein
MATNFTSSLCKNDCTNFTKINVFGINNPEEKTYIKTPNYPVKPITEPFKINNNFPIKPYLLNG